MTRPIPRRSSLAWVLMLAVGCGPGAPSSSVAPVAPSSNSPGEASSEPAARAAASAVGTASADAAEKWDVCLIQGQKVGYIRTRVSSSDDEGGTPLERIELEQVLTLGRFGQQVRQEMQLVSWERPTGELVRFESRVTAGRELTVSRGRVEGDKLTIESTTPGKTERMTIDWKPEWGGFHATERLVRQGLKPHQRRTVRALAPVLHQVGTSELEAQGFEAVRIQGESLTLLKIRKVDTLGAIRIESSLWVDDKGEVLKSFLPMPPPGLEAVRATREVALADTPPATFDLGAATVVKIAGMPRDPHGASNLTYRARLADAEIADVFTAGASQHVQIIDEHTAEITVRAVRPDSPPPERGESPPTDDDRRPNGLIQSDDAAVVAMSREAAPEEQDAWRLAVALEALVRQRVKTKNFTQALASAAEVVRTGEGDCTEHAVLLAALCRARGLPARVAIGLVYAPSVDGFAYHMWNEVWIRDRWIPLDATLARQGIGGGHLKLVATSLHGVDAYAAFLPVFQVLGRLQLDVVEP